MSAEGAQPAQSVLTVDVSAVSRLRARVGHASTSLKIIGFLSAIDAFVVCVKAGVPAPIELLVAIAVFWFARSAAVRMRSGTPWAMRVAAGWLALSSVTTALNVIPKSLAAGLNGFSALGLTVFIAPLWFLARGLLAWKRRQSPDAAARASVAGPLAEFPWERGRRAGRKRPRFLNKKSASAYVFLVLTPIPWIMFALSAAGGRTPSDNTAQRAGQYTAVILIHLLVWVWMVKIYRKARRHAMLRASEVVRADPRAAVLYLRSFRDDRAIRVRARATNGRILPERLVKIAFEEVITDHLWSYGPVVAIADPALKDERTPLGAARDFATDAEWQAKAMDLMRAASIIVATAGRTGGLVWEIESIVSAGLQSKLILLIPPVAPAQVRSRWEFLRAALPAAQLPAEIDLHRTCAVVFPRGAPTLIHDRRHCTWAYETVLDAAVLMIQREAPRIHQAPTVLRSQTLL